MGQTPLSVWCPLNTVTLLILTAFALFGKSFGFGGAEVMIYWVLILGNLYGYLHFAFGIAADYKRILGIQVFTLDKVKVEEDYELTSTNEK